MAVLRFRPFRLLRLSRAAGSRDDRGDYLPGAAEWTDEGVECDASRASLSPDGGKYDDGGNPRYAWTLFLPPGAPPYRLGETVRVVGQDGETVAEGPIRGVMRLQLQTKLLI